MDLVDHVRRTIERHHLLSTGGRVLAALSGGSDSVALAHLLRELHRAGDLRLVGLAHFNHQLRGAAEGEERFCEELAASLDVPVAIGRDDVGALARRERRSIEDAARTARYVFLEAARSRLEADVVALGHTRDDQAETFLLRLLRGAGAKGLASMHPRAGAFIRPLLDCRRRNLRDYLEARGMAWVSDESNEDVSVPRNRVRAELLPLLERRFNPSIVDVLADEAEVAREEYWHLEAAVDAWWAQFGRAEGHRRLLDRQALICAADPAVARAVMRRAMTDVAGGRPVAFGDVDRALRLATDGGPAFDAPGQRVDRLGADVVLTGRTPGAVGRPGRPTGAAGFHYVLPVPGEIWLTEAGCALSAEIAGPADWVAAVGGAFGGEDPVAAIQLSAVQLSAVESSPLARNAVEGAATLRLAVRSRRPGDRFRPFGLGGHKTLQDFLVDRKVAREHRDAVPLVVDQADRIVWVAGHSIDETFRVTDSAQSVIILRLKAVGGSA